MGLAQPQRPAGPAPGRGAGGDPLLFRPGPRTPKPELALPDEDEKTKPVYPPWLVDAWKRRGAWWDDGSYRVAPRLFRRWEAALLRAEHEWRMGADPQRVRDGMLRSEFPTLMKEGLKADSLPSLQRLEPRYRPAEPETPRSVGLAEGLGRKPDRALAKAVLAWLMQIRNRPPTRRPRAPGARRGGQGVPGREQGGDRQGRLRLRAGLGGARRGRQAAERGPARPAGPAPPAGPLDRAPAAAAEGELRGDAPPGGPRGPRGRGRPVGLVGGDASAGRRGPPRRRAGRRPAGLVPLGAQPARSGRPGASRRRDPAPLARLRRGGGGQGVPGSGGPPL